MSDADLIRDLYKKRKELYDEGFCFTSKEVSDVEREIDNLEVLPTLEEVLTMISDGRMKSIFS